MPDGNKEAGSLPEWDSPAKGGGENLHPSPGIALCTAHNNQGAYSSDYLAKTQDSLQINKHVQALCRDAPTSKLQLRLQDSISYSTAHTLTASA